MVQVPVGEQDCDRPQIIAVQRLRELPCGVLPGVDDHAVPRPLAGDRHITGPSRTEDITIGRERPGREEHREHPATLAGGQ